MVLFAWTLFHAYRSEAHICLKHNAHVLVLVLDVTQSLPCGDAGHILVFDEICLDLDAPRVLWDSLVGLLS